MRCTRSAAGLADSEEPLAKDLGATLGLKKSSSLESLQTAVSEVRKAQTPFYKPRPHMVRGRGCNESFRAAIDKSYDGPPGTDDDNLSDQSSDQETPASSSSRQRVGDMEHITKDKKKKLKGKKKDKSKGKGKDGDEKKMRDGKEQDKKAKKKGFRLLREALIAQLGFLTAALQPQCWATATPVVWQPALEPPVLLKPGRPESTPCFAIGRGSQRLSPLTPTAG
ncbi:hypothetical protein Z043_105541 [Scleropages formosus]|uniref:Uncharacterized protein n=1 Tax=Scleropages formosus TaxID=113540 RepID=A0A0N8K1L0_SCLFO|nr:hypothetical protein Z043_105541 [Scleropages formosus]